MLKLCCSELTKLQESAVIKKGFNSKQNYDNYAA